MSSSQRLLKCFACMEMKHPYEYSKSQKKRRSRRRCKVCVGEKNQPKSALESTLNDIYQHNKIKEEQEMGLLNAPTNNHIVNRPEIRSMPYSYQLLLMDGYIRECLSNQSVPLYPKIIHNIIFDFYTRKEIEFYTKHHGRSLKFTSNSVRKVMEDCQRSACLFGEESINISEYSEYKIKFSWYGMYFYMGYLTIPLQKYCEVSGYWDILYPKWSVSIRVDSRKDKWYLYDKDNEDSNDENDNVLTKYDYKWSEQEIFEMVFNFTDREWIVYVNDKKVISLPIDARQETIHVGFCLSGWGNEKISILDYSLIKRV
eukprot:279230_1